MILNPQFISQPEGEGPHTTPSTLHGSRLTAHIESVNVGTPQELRWRGKPQYSAIWKHPVEGRVLVRGVNLEGDDQGDRRVHGGPEKAVYVYAREDLEWWAAELGRQMEAGIFGENLTVQGIDVTGAVVGERWRIGSVVLQVVQPRLPCFKLGIKMGTQRFVRRFALAGRPGAYMTIVEEGELGAGDEIEVLHRPDHGISVGFIADAYHKDPSRAATIAGTPGLIPMWQEWAEKRMPV